MTLFWSGTSAFAEFFERGQGGFTFGGLFVFASSACKFNTFVRNGAFKERVVVGTGDLEGLIFRRLG